jgi:CRP-like cAMP-binding protein
MHRFDVSYDSAMNQAEDYSPRFQRLESSVQPKMMFNGSNAIVKSRQFRRKETITFDSYESWLIESGIVRAITWDPDGTVYTIGFWGPGNIISRSMISVEPYQVECLSLVRATPRNLGPKLEDLAVSFGQLSELLKIVQKRCTGSRLLLFIEWFNKQFSTILEDGSFHNYRLTHQELAESTCTTRVTVTRLLQSYEQQGLIERSKRYILKTSRCSQLHQTKARDRK